MAALKNIPWRGRGRLDRIGWFDRRQKHSALDPVLGIIRLVPKKCTVEAAVVAKKMPHDATTNSVRKEFRSLIGNKCIYLRTTTNKRKNPLAATTARGCGFPLSDLLNNVSTARREIEGRRVSVFAQFLYRTFLLLFLMRVKGRVDSDIFG
jgi:hypothetical protein